MTLRFRLSLLAAVTITVAAFTGLVVAAGQGVQEPALTDAQRNQVYQQDWADFQAAYTSWLSRLDVSRLSFNSLRHVDMAAAYMAPDVSSLHDAAAKADRVVLVRATAIKPTAFAGTYVTVTVERTLKGTPAQTLIIHEGGGLRPTRDWQGVYITDAADAPLLLPGDRAFLLLDQSNGELRVQPFTGMYRIRSGVIAALPGNPFGSTASGHSEQGFSADLAAAVSAQAQ